MNVALSKRAELAYGEACLARYRKETRFARDEAAQCVNMQTTAFDVRTMAKTVAPPTTLFPLSYSVRIQCLQIT